MISSKEFAKIIRSYGSFSNKKLQKLCYYVYSIYLSRYGEKIADVYFEAWVHGPVSPEIYQLYKNYGWNNIPQYIGRVEVSDEIYNRVSNIIDEYIDYSANQLEDMTHREEPWINARLGCGKYDSSNNLICDEDIITCYQR